MIRIKQIESYKTEEISNLKKRGWKEIGSTGLYSDEDKSYFLIALEKDFNPDTKVL